MKLSPLLRSLRFFFIFMQWQKRKKAAKKRADHYEPKVKTDLSFDELIAMSLGKKPKEEKEIKKK